MNNEFWNAVVPRTFSGLSVLVLLISVEPLQAASPSARAPVKPAAPAEWTMPAQNYESTRFSPLDEINTQNVAELKESWSFDLGTDRGAEAAPLIVGTTMYMVTPYPNALFALDLSQPHSDRVLKWKYEPKPVPASQEVACCEVVNRGACYADGRVFMNTLDGHTIAVDAATGREIWNTQVANIQIGETITMAPLVASGKVLVGISGGEMGVRGWLKGLDPASGLVLWSAVDGAAWGRVSYDPHLNLIYGVAAAGNEATELDSDNNGLKSGAFALNPDTGHARWFHPWSPALEFEPGRVNENILVDLPLNRGIRQVLLHTERNGYVYVVDRATGQKISATAIARGASSSNHQPAAYSPRTQLLYIPYENLANDVPFLALNAGMSPAPAPSRDVNHGGFTAWDPVAKKAVWTLKERFPIGSGTLVTGGDVVFYGTVNGKFNAVNAHTGKVLWTWTAKSGIIGQPVTYRGPDRKQYVAIQSGSGGGSEKSETLHVFSLR